MQKPILNKNVKESKTIMEHPIDLTLIGIGENGHIALMIPLLILIRRLLIS